MALNSLGVEKKSANPAPVTLPVLNFKNANAQREAQEDQRHRDTIKIIKQGRDCWEAIGRAASFESWTRIGAAFAVGKAHALRVTGANRAWGQNYSREFGEWMNSNGFGQMRKSLRSHCIELHENIE